MRIGNEIVTASALGKRRRMFRIFGGKGKCIVVPLDDNLISKYNEGLKNLHDKIKDIQQAKPNGVLCYLGTASIIDKYEVPIILNLTASTEYKTHTKKILVSTIEQAIAIDAAAVAVHINVSSSYESIMLENLGAVSEVCQKYGMPLLVIVYPRTEHAGNACSYREDQITELAKNKKIEICFDWGRMFYNERSCKAKSIDFVWPTILARKDEEVLAYEAKLKETQKANYLYYNNYVYQKEKGMFSSYDAEERVGYAFLKYGIKICNQLNKSTFRPLGLTTPPSFGFGSLVATDYNISNTAPLVMWWGSLEVNDAGPVGCWYPLFPRRDNKKLYSYVAAEESAVSIHNCTLILKTVYRLAVDEYQKDIERRREGICNHGIFDLMSLDLESLTEKRKQSDLLGYLLSLNFEHLKVVQTVMYIGRDYETMLQTECDDEYDEEYDEEDFSRNTISFPVPNPDFVLYEWLRDLEECKGWKSKRIEAEQVYQKKSSLHIYLERAFRILGIEY